MAAFNTVVILAAGLGSRFGGNKPFARFGPLQKTLMEYNLHHALQSGFEQVVFVIKPQDEAILKREVISHLDKKWQVDIAYQTFDDLPKTCQVPSKRTKPLGTAHALWCARKYLTRDFVVINADDYYGKQAFSLSAEQPANLAFLVGYQINNTLSDNGGVNRGICHQQQNQLIDIEEFVAIEKISDDKIQGTNAAGEQKALAQHCIVSMNFWGLTPNIATILEQQLTQKIHRDMPANLECFLPDTVKRYLKNQPVRVLTSQDSWFGVSYAADSHAVDQALTRLADEGLFAQLA